VQRCARAVAGSCLGASTPKSQEVAHRIILLRQGLLSAHDLVHVLSAAPDADDLLDDERVWPAPPGAAARQQRGRAAAGS
jgi:hypothetical protein